MSFIPNDWHSGFTAAIGRQDAVLARKLYHQAEAAALAGNAQGFERDMARLAEISGIEKGRHTVPTPETALAKAASVRRLPPELDAQCDVVTRFLKSAETPAEKAASIKAGQDLLAEIATHDIMTKSLQANNRLTMGLAR